MPVELSGFTHVGKKFTNPSPSSCAQPMTARIGTLGSLTAMIRPANALRDHYMCI